MSLPTGKPAQTSIKSFFQSKPPKYAPPPGSAAPAPPTPTTTSSTPPPPPPAASASAAAATVAATSNIPPQATIRPVEPSDLDALRRINALLLPVPYPDDFYRRAAEQQSTSRIITWTDDAAQQPKVVGGVVCRVESSPGRPTTLYIRSLCVLAPYRGLGLVAAAVDAVVAAARADDTLLAGDPRGPDAQIETLSAHVWTDNDDALHWYEARGFRKTSPRPIEGYYRQLRPDSAWLVTRDMAPLSQRATAPASASPTVKPSPTAAVVNLPPISAAAAGGPPKRPDPPTPGQSFQNQRPETEWNDLPADMAPPKAPGSSAASDSSGSRPASAARKKRDRSYPAAAFGA